MTEHSDTTPRPTTGPPGRWTRTDTISVIAVVVLTTLFFLPNIASRPLGGTVEAKSALAARKLLREHQLFVAEIDVALINKPPVFYWLIAATSALAGTVTEWTVRLPNTLACVASVLLVWALGRRLWDRWTGLVSAAVLATMVQFRWMAQAARTDSVVTFSVAAALFCFWQALSAEGDSRNRRSWCWSIAAWVALAVGVGTKGPVGLAIVGLSIASVVTLRRITGEGRLRDDITRLHPFAGLLIVVALTAPLYLGTERASNGTFLRRFFLQENLARAGISTGGAAGFKKVHPVYYYLTTLWVYALPWSFFIPAAIALSVTTAKRCDRGREWFVLLAFTVPLLFLSLVAVKKWSYLMPIFPALALLCGRFWTVLLREGLPRGWFVRWATWTASALYAALALVLAAGMTWLVNPDLFGGVGKSVKLPPALVALSRTGFIGLIVVFSASAATAIFSVSVFRRKFRLAFAMLVCVTVLGLCTHSFIVEPGYWSMQSRRDFARHVNAWRTKHPSPAGPVTVCAGEQYELLFYLAGRPRVVRPPDAGAFLARVRNPDTPGPGETALVVVEEEVFETLNRSIGPLQRIVSTGENDCVDQPLVMMIVKLVPSDDGT